ncbi:MAG: anaerobic sulfatase maturase [Saprospiraceae bacterium]|nr:anaerobic sulfatase maturase [Saprospiraceae bacterium]
MANNLQAFQIFAKPVGARCNLHCQYCYYLDKNRLHQGSNGALMDDEILEQYIIQHIQAADSSLIVFSWHGGEPTLAGLNYYKKIVRLQQKYKPAHSKIINGIQTNGTLLNDEWSRFFASEAFVVGVSQDGPQKINDLHPKTIANKSAFELTMKGIDLLNKYKISFEILCVVHSVNVNDPLGIYRFLKQTGTQYISFIPLVENEIRSRVNPENVPSEKYGQFLTAIFDEWKNNDIGKIKVQIFEEALRTAFNLEHSLCIFREICGEVPVIEHNGDFYACDHFVNPDHLIGNIKKTSLRQLIDSPVQKAFGLKKLNTLPKYCITCSVRNMCNGGCPKNRFIESPDGEPGLNYLCRGYKMFFNHISPFINEIRMAHLNQAKE